MLQYTKLVSYSLISLFSLFYTVKISSQTICFKTQIHYILSDYSEFTSSIINSEKSFENKKIRQLSNEFIDTKYKSSDNIIIKIIFKIIIYFIKYKFMILIENNKLLSPIDIKKQFQPPEIIKNNLAFSFYRKN
jgi:hypothetical protein